MKFNMDRTAYVHFYFYIYMFISIIMWWYICTHMICKVYRGSTVQKTMYLLYL